MFSGTVTITCSKCAKAYTKEFSDVLDPPSRDAMLAESHYVTGYASVQIALCTDCSPAWNAKCQELTDANNQSLLEHLAENPKSIAVGILAKKVPG